MKHRETGMEIDGFTLGEKIHQGGFATIWVATHALSRTPLILKVPTILDGYDRPTIVGFEMVPIDFGLSRHDRLSDLLAEEFTIPMGTYPYADISAAPALLDKMPPPTRLLADKGYDANSLRERLAASKTKAVIPSTRSRKTPIPYDAVACIVFDPGL